MNVAAAMIAAAQRVSSGRCSMQNITGMPGMSPIVAAERTQFANLRVAHAPLAQLRPRKHGRGDLPLAAERRARHALGFFLRQPGRQRVLFEIRAVLLELEERSCDVDRCNAAL